MLGFDLVAKSLRYGKRHGIGPTFSRGITAARRAAAGNWMVIYACSLPISSFGLEQPESAEVRRYDGAEPVPETDLHRIANEGHAATILRLVRERVAAGSSLWIYRLDQQLAGYGWSLAGRTMEPHFFPVGPNDAHLFDFFVFPEFRGNRINPRLVNHILSKLSLDGRSRALIEAASWNVAQISSLRRTPFQKIGVARTWNLFGKTIVEWRESLQAPRVNLTEKEKTCLNH